MFSSGILTSARAAPIGKGLAGSNGVAVCSPARSPQRRWQLSNAMQPSITFKFLNLKTTFNVKINIMWQYLGIIICPISIGEHATINPSIR
jgi:hypothetical protein